MSCVFGSVQPRCKGTNIYADIRSINGVDLSDTSFMADTLIDYCTPGQVDIFRLNYLPPPELPSVGVKFNGSKVRLPRRYSAPIAGCVPGQNDGVIASNNSSRYRVKFVRSVLAAEGI